MAADFSTNNIDSARISLLIRGMNRKYPPTQGRWQISIRDDGGFKLFSNEKVIIIPRKVMNQPSVLDIFNWIETNEI